MMLGNDSGEMRMSALGRTGVMVSRLCLGAWQFGARTSVDDSKRLLALAFDAGVNFVDTADIYGGDIGQSECIIGEYLQKAGCRDRIVVASKVYFQTDSNDTNSQGVSR